MQNCVYLRKCKLEEKQSSSIKYVTMDVVDIVTENVVLIIREYYH